LAPELSLEELVAKPNLPSLLKGLGKSGSGFFVTGTGVSVTNAHLARGEESLHTLLPPAASWKAKSSILMRNSTSPWFKVASAPTEIESPHLTLGRCLYRHQGESVIAIGNSRDAMLFERHQRYRQRRGTFPSAGPAPGFRPTRQSIPVTARPDAHFPRRSHRHQTRKNSSRKCYWHRFALSATDLLESSTASIPTPCR